MRRFFLTAELTVEPADDHVPLWISVRGISVEPILLGPIRTLPAQSEAPHATPLAPRPTQWQAIWSPNQSKL